MSGILSAICTNYAIASAFPTVQVLVVAGGGAGGDLIGGGGGGGGVIYESAYVITDNTSYPVTVGVGGTAGSFPSRGGNGGNSIFDSLTAIGGGGGGPNGTTGATGGSGGGGGGATGGDGNTGGSGTASQGYAGGNGDTTGVLGCGGGGGAGGVGANGTGGNGGAGGDGIQNSISGTPTYYGGGGGGGTYLGGTLGTGGLGGGGDAGASDNGTDGLGGGGGGSKDNGNFDGNGGSGVVVISYVTGGMTATGGTITSSGGNTIHTFTSSGSFVVGTPPVTYATWNPADKSSGITLSNGNLTIDGTLFQWCNVRSTISKTSGKWYWEIHIDSSDNMGRINNGIGINTASLDTYYLGYDTTSWGFITPQKIHSNTFTNYSTALSVGDTLGVALDMDNHTISYLINNVSQGVAFSSIDSAEMFAMAGIFYSGATTTTNFGATAFAYTPPVGYNSGLYE